MNSTPVPDNLEEVRILCFNVARSYEHVDSFLERNKSRFDIVFLQEPPWKRIRSAPSTRSKEGDDVTGAPNHPDWLAIVRPPDADEAPRVMAYVSRRLASYRPALRRDIVDH